MKHVVLACALMLFASVLLAEDDSAPKDFPTVERVLFVEACVRDHPDRARTEMIYKCSCAMDVIVAELNYGEYVEASTAFFAAQVAGERGTEIRESTEGKALAQRYRDARSKAMQRCMIQ
ncbi:MAG TPA: hypothetical protein VFA81_05200 [Burkholderiales bacterium]|nr:hypothetical protein [Burkholderiales bacterium]